MTAIVEHFIKHFESQRAALHGNPEDDDIFRPMLGTPGFDYPPRVLYFYYVRVKRNGKVRIRHYCHYEEDPRYPDDCVKKWKEIPRDNASLSRLAADMLDNARSGGTKYEEIGRNFAGIEWRRRCYIVIAMDEKHWKLWRKSNTGSSIVFITTKGGVDYTKNYSFFDGQDLEPLPHGTDTYSAIAFINHIKTGPGDPERAAFQFNILLRAALDDDEHRPDGPPMDVILDPGGTNISPPITP
ncbi:MAG TPA: hypothetical protein VF727_10415 [Allosphingosinicella sp.]|jgi:hypothetical protein